MIEQRFHVPAISVCGAEEWLGEWTFALPQGSMTDEPIYWAQLLAQGGHTEVGVLIEQSLIGESYARNFRKACGAQASASWRKNGSRRPRKTSARRSGGCTRRADCTRALRIRVRCRIRQPALRELDWDPPRFMGTAFENAWINGAIGRRSSGGRASTSTTRATPSDRRSSTGSRRRRVAARSTAPRS